MSMRPLLLLAIAPLLLGCGSSAAPAAQGPSLPEPGSAAYEALRTRECNDLVDIINRTAAAIERLGDGGADLSQPELEVMAAALEQAASDIARRTLSLPPLQQRAGSYADMARRSAAAARALSGAVKARDAAAIERGLPALQAAVEPEDRVIESVNAFCLGQQASSGGAISRFVF